MKKQMYELIKSDIIKCENQKEIKGSQHLFERLISKYRCYDEKIDKKVTVHNHISSGEEFDYRHEIQNICEVLKMYLINDKLEIEVLTEKEKIEEYLREIEFMMSSTNQSDLKDNIVKYIEICSYFSTKIQKLGNGCYEYYEQQEFFSDEISESALKHNLIIIKAKIESYYGTKFGNKKISNTKNNELSISKTCDTSKVFIVHGHDQSVLNEVDLLLRKLSLLPIILSKQPNSGKTIIEKLIDYSKETSFAIVLYTGCDIGNSKEEKTLNPRARQNVVFEHGFFTALLGRQNVVVLISEGVEKPSDIDGIVYIAIDKTGNWKFNLSREMKNAGLNIDLNNLD